MILGGLLQLLQDDRGDFRRRVLLAAHFDPRVAVVRLDDLIGDARRLLRDLRVLAPHESLDGENSVLGIGHRLSLGDLTDQPLTVLRKPDDRRRRPPAFLVDDDSGFPAFHDRDDRVGGPEVDSDDFAHVR
jgi:hypothetical protein